MPIEPEQLDRLMSRVGPVLTDRRLEKADLRRQAAAFHDKIERGLTRLRAAMSELARLQDERGRDNPILADRRFTCDKEIAGVQTWWEIQLAPELAQFIQDLKDCSSGSAIVARLEEILHTPQKINGSESAQTKTLSSPRGDRGSSPAGRSVLAGHGGTAAAMAPAGYSLQPATPILGDGLIAISEAGDVYPIPEWMAQCLPVLERVRDKVGLLADYKTLHDLLHTLQHQCYDLLVIDTGRFPEDASAVMSLIQHESTIQKMIDDLFQLANSPTADALDRKAWIKLLDNARRELHDGVENENVKLLRTAERRLNQFLGTQPTRINLRLVQTARELPLRELVAAMRSIRKILEDRGLDQMKLARLDGDVRCLEERREELLKLVGAHDHWQELDLEFRRIEAETRGRDEELIGDLEICCEYLQERTEEVAGVNEDWAFRLREDGRRLAGAIRDRDPGKVSRYFQRYRQRAGERFYVTDCDLKRLCEQLRELKTPLDVLLGRLQ